MSDTLAAAGAPIGGVGSSELGAPPHERGLCGQLDRIDGEVDAKRAAYPLEYPPDR